MTSNFKEEPPQLIFAVQWGFHWNIESRLGTLSLVLVNATMFLLMTVIVMISNSSQAVYQVSRIHNTNLYFPSFSLSQLPSASQQIGGLD